MSTLKDAMDRVEAIQNEHAEKMDEGEFGYGLNE
jgi:hypothetical protein